MRPAALAALISSGVGFEQALLELGIDEVQDELIQLAIRVGAPLVPTLLLLEQQLVHQERSASEIAQSQAIPQATRKLLLWLPAGTVLISQLAGLNTLQGLLTPVGLIALVVSVGLIFAGAKISSRMLRRLDSGPSTKARELIALNICISAGLGLDQVTRELRGLGPESRDLISLSQRTGASLSALLRSEVAASNEKLIGEQLTQAKKLSISLLIPLAATTLPAFLLLTIVPMIIGITQ